MSGVGRARAAKPIKMYLLVLIALGNFLLAHADGTESQVSFIERDQSGP